MSGRAPWGVRLACWWVGAYTSTAPDEVAGDRRQDLVADLHDELVDADASGIAPSLASRRIAGRVVRGVAADLLWRISVEWAPGRWSWHLRHPRTVILAGCTLLVPVVLLADATRREVATGTDVAVLAGLITLLSASVVSFGLLSFVVSVAGVLRGDARRATVFTGLPRAAGALAGFLGALAALWRFEPSPLGSVSAAAYVGFFLCVVALVLAGLSSAAVRLWRKRRT